MTVLFTGLQGVQNTLQEFIALYRHQSPQQHTASSVTQNGTSTLTEVGRTSQHFDTRRNQEASTIYVQPDSQPTPSSGTSYDTHFSPTVTQPHAGSFPNMSTQAQPSHPAFSNLPPIAISSSVMPPPRNPTSLPSLRTHLMEFQSNVRASQPSNQFQRPGSSRANIPSSNVTSADSSDDEGAGELPGAGLVAPLEVLRGLGEEHEIRAVSLIYPYEIPLNPQ